MIYYTILYYAIASLLSLYYVWAVALCLSSGCVLACHLSGMVFLVSEVGRRAEGGGTHSSLSTPLARERPTQSQGATSIRHAPCDLPVKLSDRSGRAKLRDPSDLSGGLKLSANLRPLRPLRAPREPELITITITITITIN